MKPSNFSTVTLASPVSVNQPLLQLEPSKPIPIKRTFSDSRESEVVDPSDVAHYDGATWRMYMRIANARRLRSMYLQDRNYAPQPIVSRSDNQDHHFVKLQDARQGPTATEPIAMSPTSHECSDRRMSMDEPPYDGMFILE